MIGSYTTTMPLLPLPRRRARGIALAWRAWRRLRRPPSSPTVHNTNHPPQYHTHTQCASTPFTRVANGVAAGFARETGSARVRGRLRPPCLLAQFLSPPNSSSLSVTAPLLFFLFPNRPWPSLALLVASDRPPLLFLYLAIGDTVSCCARNAESPFRSV